MAFADLHIHLLFGVDDGAADEEEMRMILDEAYADGTRVICATPHFHPGYFGANRDDADAAFSRLTEYAAGYEDLRIYIGNELRYSPGCLGWLEEGMCRTINGGRNILVDFLEDDDADYIVSSVFKLLNAGYIPVLAHAERYENFHRDMREVLYLKESGVIIQVDAHSPFGGWGRGSKKRSRKILESCIADVVASDAHNTGSRPPQMSLCYNYVAEKCGTEYADDVFWHNPLKIISG